MAARAGYYFQYVVGFSGPDEGLWGLIVDVDVIPDDQDQLFEIMEDAFRVG